MKGRGSPSFATTSLHRRSEPAMTTHHDLQHEPTRSASIYWLRPTGPSWPATSIGGEWI